MFESVADLNAFTLDDFVDQPTTAPTPAPAPVAVYKPSICYVCGRSQVESSTASVSLGNNTLLVIHALCKRGLNIPDGS